MLFALRGMDPKLLSVAAGARHRRRRGQGRAPLRARRAVTADPARDDGHRRDPGVQLPGPAALARPLHLRRRRHYLHSARGRDGDRLGRRRARHRRPGPRQRTDHHRLGRSVRGRRAGRLDRADARARAARAGPARRRQRHLRRRGQLDPAARGDPGDAGSGNGALLGRLPRLDADRQPAGRLAGGGRRPAIRPRARRDRGARRRARRLDRLRPQPRPGVQRRAGGSHTQPRGVANRPRRAGAAVASPAGARPR